jgi:hypothetical protein
LTCPALADDGPTDGGYIGPNVQITITVGDVEPGSHPVVHTYRLLARDGGDQAQMLMGWRTPIPTGGTGGERSYVYQNVGMTAKLAARVLPSGRILVAGEFEISGVRQEMDGIEKPADMPIIGTFQQALSVLLNQGKALRVAEVPDPDGGTMYLELTAEVLED